MEPLTLKRKILGCMYGLTSGDAIGFPVEFMSLAQNHQKFGPQGITDFEKAFGLRPGSYSDDSQMTLATARGIINERSNEPRRIMDSIAEEYIRWLETQNDPHENRAPGNTCLAGAQNLANGISWAESGVVGGKGCGAAMRTAPIGLVFYDDFVTRNELGMWAGRCTHDDPSAYASGMATANLVAMALKNSDPLKMVQETRKLGERYSSELEAKMHRLKEVMVDPSETDENKLKTLGEGLIGTEAIAMALYCFYRNPHDYKKTVLMAANIDGDSDSVACIAGAISGAYNGIGAIPQRWVDGVENSKLIRKISKQLYEKAHK